MKVQKYAIEKIITTRTILFSKVSNQRLPVGNGDLQQPHEAARDVRDTNKVTKAESTAHMETFRG